MSSVRVWVGVRRARRSTKYSRHTTTRDVKSHVDGRTLTTSALTAREHRDAGSFNESRAGIRRDNGSVQQRIDRLTTPDGVSVILARLAPSPLDSSAQTTRKPRPAHEARRPQTQGIASRKRAPPPRWLRSTPAITGGFHPSWPLHRFQGEALRTGLRHIRPACCVARYSTFRALRAVCSVSSGCQGRSSLLSVRRYRYARTFEKKSVSSATAGVT